MVQLLVLVQYNKMKKIFKKTNLVSRAPAAAAWQPQWAPAARDCHGFINPCRLQVRVGAGAGAGWNFSTLRKPAPASTGSGFVAGLSRVIYIYIYILLIL